MVALIKPERTHYASIEGYRASNIISVSRGFTGTLSMAPSLNPATSIATVVSVDVLGPAAVTATSLARTEDGLRANYDVPAMDTPGEYQVRVIVTTSDSQTIPTEGVLRVE